MNPSTIRRAAVVAALALPAALAPTVSHAQSAAAVANGPLLLSRAGYLYTAYLGGSGAYLMTSSGKSSQGAFSPDGRRIVYVDKSTGNGDIYVMARNGSGKQRVTTHAAADDQPVFSSDGKTIAFRSCRTKVTNEYGDKVTLCDIYLLNSTAPYGTAKKVTNAKLNPRHECDYTSYREVAFRPGRTNEITVGEYCGFWSEPGYVAQLRMTTAGANLGHLTYGWQLDWARDGQRYAYASSVDYWAPASLHIGTPTGSHELTAPSYDEGDSATSNPVWSPDGKLIAFHRTAGPADGVNKAEGTYLIRVDGTQERMFRAGYDVTDWAQK